MSDPSADDPIDGGDLDADRFQLECPDGCGSIRFVVSTSTDADFWCAECGSEFDTAELEAANEVDHTAETGEVMTDGGQTDGTQRHGPVREAPRITAEQREELIEKYTGEVGVTVRERSLQATTDHTEADQ